MEVVEAEEEKKEEEGRVGDRGGKKRHLWQRTRRRTRSAQVAGTLEVR